jgi:hypothetical protein
MFANLSLELAIYGSLGSFSQELLHWYQLRFDINKKNYQLLLRSFSYWFVVILTVLLSGLLTSIWRDDLQNWRPFDPVVFGAALPLIFKKATSVAVSHHDAKTHSWPTREGP